VQTLHVCIRKDGLYVEVILTYYFTAHVTLSKTLMTVKNL